MPTCWAARGWAVVVSSHGGVQRLQAGGTQVDQLDTEVMDVPVEDAGRGKGHWVGLQAVIAPRPEAVRGPLGDLLCRGARARVGVAAVGLAHFMCARAGAQGVRVNGTRTRTACQKNTHSLALYMEPAMVAATEMTGSGACSR